jgi:hypothetical protein
MLGERVKHVIKERDVGLDLDRSAIQPEPQIDLRLSGGALDEGVTRGQVALPAWASRSVIVSYGCTAGPT